MGSVYEYKVETMVNGVPTVYMSVYKGRMMYDYKMGYGE